MPNMDEAEVRRILDVGLRLGELLLACRAGTSDVTETVVAVTTAYGLPDIQVDVTVNSITVSVPRKVPGAPVTAMYVVESRSLDYTRLQLATDLAQHVVDKTPDLTWVREQLDVLEQAEHPYPRWVSTLGLGVMAGGFSLLLGATPVVAVLATATTAGVDRVGRVLNRWHLPFLFQQVIAATISTGVAIIVTAIGFLSEDTPITPVVAANIVALLSGMAIVSSFQDAVTGYQLTAVSRIMEIALSSAGILVGVDIAWHIGLAFNVHVHLSNELPIPLLGLPSLILAGALGAAGAAVASYAQYRAIAAAAGAGAAGSLIYHLLKILGTDTVTSSFVAAVTIGFGSAIFAHRLHVTPLVIAMAGIVPLVPGMTLFRGFAHVVRGDSAAGGSLAMAAAIALALGAGVVLGPLLAPSAQSELSRIRELVRGGPRTRKPVNRRIPQLAGIQIPSPHWTPTRRNKPPNPPDD